MASYGTVALVLYFGIVFALWSTGSYITQGNTDDINAYMNKTAKANPTDITNNIINIFSSPITLVTTGAGALFGYALGGATLAMSLGLIIFISNLLITPISLVSSLNFPEPFNILLIGFMNLLLIVAIISFIGKRDL